MRGEAGFISCDEKFIILIIKARLKLDGKIFWNKVSIIHNNNGKEYCIQYSVTCDWLL